MQTKDSMGMLSSKMEKLKLQAEKLPMILSGKLNELEEECLQVLSSGTKNAQPMVALSLNGAAEFINTLLTKVEDFCQLSEEDESNIWTESEMMTSLSELTERVKVLEKSALAVQTGGDDKKQKAVEVKFDNLASETSHRMNGFETQLCDVMSDLDTVRRTLTSVSFDVTICTKNGEENKRRLEKFNEHVEDLASVSSELKDCNERIKSLQSDVDGVERQVEDLASITSELKDCNERIKSLQSDVDHVEAQVEDLTPVTTKVKESSTRIDKLESKLSCVEHAVEDLDSISATVGDCKKRVDNLQSKVCCMENTVENVDRGNRKMKEQLKKVSANQTSLNKTVEEKEDRQKEVEAKFDNLASETSHRINGFETQLYDLMSDLETVRRTLTSVSSDVTICTKNGEENERRMEKFDEHVEELASVSSELKDCNERIKSLRSDVDHVETQVEDLTFVSTKVKESSTRIDKLESKLSCVEHAVEDLDSISARVGDCKKRVDNLQSKVCCTENAVENVDRGNRKMKEQLKKVSANQTRLNKSVEEKEDRNKQVNQLLTKKVHQLETLQDILGELKLRADNKDKSMEDTVKATRSQVLELKDSYDTLSTQLTQVSGAPVGFTAILRVQGTKVKPDSELGGILYAHINRGNCYKDQEGHFVAPRDGLYGFFFWVQQRGNVRFNLRLVIEGGSGIIYPVNNNSAHSALYVYDLSSNTRVYLKVKDSDGQKVTLDDLIFTGWSIGYH